MRDWLNLERSTALLLILILFVDGTAFQQLSSAVPALHDRLRFTHLSHTCARQLDARTVAVVDTKNRLGKVRANFF